jgi:hypothetical protein
VWHMSGYPAGPSQLLHGGAHILPDMHHGCSQVQSFMSFLPSSRHDKLKSCEKSGHTKHDRQKPSAVRTVKADPLQRKNLFANGLKPNYQHPPRLLAVAGRACIRTCLNTCITTASWRCPLRRCSEKVKQKYLSDHQRVCPHRTVICHRCETVYKTLAAESHEEVCPEVEIMCSNTEIRNGTTVDECKQKYKRKDAALHESICKLAIVDCVYAPLGCGARILRKDMNQHLVDNVLSHARISVTKLARVAATVEAQPSKAKKNVTWQVDWPLPEGFSELDSKKVAIGEYLCWLRLRRDPGGTLFVEIRFAEASQVSELHFLFPASMDCSSLTVVHPSDDHVHKSKKLSFPAFRISYSIFGNSNGPFTTLTVDEAPDFVHDGKLTIKAEIQIAPATTEREFSLN